jgi:hypothetical protein
MEVGVQIAGRRGRPESLETEGRLIVETLGGQWRRSGGMCRCPAHEDRTPSLSVRAGDRRLLFHCFAGCQTRSVIGALCARGLLAPDRAAGGGDGTWTPADPGRSARNWAARLWAAARPLQGSPAEAYLAGRGLAVETPALRFHGRTPYGRGSQPLMRPAMLAAVCDPAGLVAVHRTFLDLDPPRLAVLPGPRRGLGRLGQGAVRLGRPAGGTLGLAEGIETAIAASQLSAIACWATLGSERFGRVAIPDGVERLVLFLDNDGGGRRAEQLARAAYGGRCALEPRYAQPAGADWNDVLSGADRPPGAGTGEARAR